MKYMKAKNLISDLKVHRGKRTLMFRSRYGEAVKDKNNPMTILAVQVPPSF